jgi:hypothetical protein
MAVQDVVRVLVVYYEDGEEAFREARGPDAAIVVRDMIDLLEDELGGQLDYDALWAEFEAAPRETAPDLAGSLEALVEADPGLANQLEVHLEAYYATGREVEPTQTRGTPESEASEFVPREEQRIKRHEVEPRSHTDVAGEGTYLYGNVRAGDDVAVEKSVDAGPDVLAGGRELEMLSLDVDKLFDQLRATVDRKSALKDEVKAELRQELKELEVELMLGEDADEEQIVEHLRRVGDLDPDFLDLLLTGLSQARTEATYLVENAIERAREG